MIFDLVSREAEDFKYQLVGLTEKKDMEIVCKLMAIKSFDFVYHWNTFLSLLDGVSEHERLTRE